MNCVILYIVKLLSGCLSCHNIVNLQVKCDGSHSTRATSTFYHKNYKRLDRFKKEHDNKMPRIIETQANAVLSPLFSVDWNVNGIITMVCIHSRKNMKLIQTTTILNANNYSISVQSVLRIRVHCTMCIRFMHDHIITGIER